MRSFEYVRPGSVAEAARFLADNEDDALAIGGGTAAVVLMNMGVLRPRYVVDLSGLDELRRMDATDAGLRLGALTTLRSLERETMVRDGWGLLAEAASQVANVRVRNVATIGGSIAYGEPQTDTPVALIAMGATVGVSGPERQREVALADFFHGPYETALETGELITGISVPRPAGRTGGCHVKFTVGSPENKPVANAAAMVRLDDAGHCADVSIVMGAVGPVPVVASDAAGKLWGEVPSESLIAEVAAAASEAADPIDDLRGPVWYKRRIIKVLVGRALTCALSRATA